MLIILNSMQSFGVYIARRREELGLSQRDLAKQVGVTHAVISRIESGQAGDFRFSTFLGLSAALQVHPMHLIRLYEGETDPTPESVHTGDDEALVEAFRAFLEQRRSP
jgi:transcriptional regulator with XRE-family HTH domain